MKILSAISLIAIIVGASVTAYQFAVAIPNSDTAADYSLAWKITVESAVLFVIGCTLMAATCIRDCSR